MNRKRLKRKIKKIFDPKMIMVYFVVTIMVGSGLGFVMNYNFGGTSVDYFNDHRVRQTAQGFQVLYEGDDLEFLNHPRQLSVFDMPEDVVNTIEDVEQFTVSFDPEIQDRGELQYAQQTIFEHSMSLDKIVGIGVTEENMVHDYNIVTCNDSTQTKPVIKFEEGNESQVTFNQTNSCIEVISRDPFHRIEFAEALSFNLLGIYE